MVISADAYTLFSTFVGLIPGNIVQSIIVDRIGVSHYTYPPPIHETYKLNKCYSISKYVLVTEWKMALEGMHEAIFFISRFSERTYVHGFKSFSWKKKTNSSLIYFLEKFLSP